MELTYRDVILLVSWVEFELMVNPNGTLSLYDTQHANLGNIEGDEFTTFPQVLDRLEIYFNDYIVEPICDHMGIEDYKDWEDLLNQVRHLRDTHFDVQLLEMIVEGT
jgi:hypothetical protein